MAKKARQDQYIGTAKMAEELDVSQRAIQKAIRAEELKARRFGRRYLVERLDFEDYKARALKPV